MKKIILENLKKNLGLDKEVDLILNLMSKKK